MITHLIQCKFTNQIGNPIDAGLSADLRRMRSNWRAESAAVYGISNSSSFATTARRVAEENRARLVSRHELNKLSQILVESR